LNKKFPSDSSNANKANAFKAGQRGGAPQPSARELQALAGKNAAERADWANTGGLGLNGLDSHPQQQQQQPSLGFGSVYSLSAHGDPPLALLAATAALLGEPRSITRASAAAAGATLASGLEAVAEKLGVPRLLDANEFLHEECVLLFLAELVRDNAPFFVFRALILNSTPKQNWHGCMHTFSFEINPCLVTSFPFGLYAILGPARARPCPRSFEGRGVSRHGARGVFSVPASSFSGGSESCQATRS